MNRGHHTRHRHREGGARPVARGDAQCLHKLSSVLNTPGGFEFPWMSIGGSSPLLAASGRRFDELKNLPVFFRREVGADAHVVHRHFPLGIAVSFVERNRRALTMTETELKLTWRRST